MSEEPRELDWSQRLEKIRALDWTKDDPHSWEVRRLYDPYISIQDMEEMYGQSIPDDDAQSAPSLNE